MEAGDGPPLIHLHGAGGLRLTRAHDLLSQTFRVIVFEMPGFGMSHENAQTQSMAEMAATMVKAAAGIGLDRFNLMGSSFGGKVALWLAVQHPAAVSALVTGRTRGHPSGGNRTGVRHVRGDRSAALCSS